MEDILESWHIENLEELKTRLHDCQVYHLKNNSNETLIHNLKNELAELKQNAIVLPNFKKGQEVFIIRNNEVIKANFQQFSNWIDAEVVYNPHTTICDDGFVDVDYDFDMVNYEMVFATKEEAEQKLAEIKGE